MTTTKHPYALEALDATPSRAMLEIQSGIDAALAVMSGAGCVLPAALRGDATRTSHAGVAAEYAATRWSIGRRMAFGANRGMENS